MLKKSLESFKVPGRPEQEMFLGYIEKIITYISDTRQDVVD